VDAGRPGAGPASKHLITDRRGTVFSVLTVLPTGGNRNYVTQFPPLLNAIPSPGPPRRTRTPLPR
jgi:hypothetical protein